MPGPMPGPMPGYTRTNFIQLLVHYDRILSLKFVWQVQKTVFRASKILGNQKLKQCGEFLNSSSIYFWRMRSYFLHETN